MTPPQRTNVIGIDGCPTGWIGVALLADGSERVELFSHFSEVLNHPLGFAKIAVDMPIGLPDRIEGPGRGPEQAVRPHLGARQSSVFSIPSRAAVMEEDYRKACDIALETSNPPKKISKQGFNIFPKIREIDALMTPALENRVYEVHPELAFWRLNKEQPLATPKKVKSRVNPAGVEERTILLEKAGLAHDFLQQQPPKGAAMDDFVDACACAVIARRALTGNIEAFPKDYQRDVKGLRVAIWA